jgi:anti-sigma-K factor RskA
MTRPSDTHDAFLELAAGYALYALEPEDEQTFLAHLSACAECERAVAEHQDTLAHLAYSADAGEPPPALLEGIRAGVRESGRASTYAAPASLDRARTDRARRTTDGLRLRRAATWLGAAAAFALIGSLAVWNTSLQRDQQEASGDLDRILQALSTSDTRAVQLQRPDSTDVVAVALVHDGSMDLVVTGLQANEAEQTSYVLWGKNELGGVRAVGAFDVSVAPHQVLEDITLDGEMTAFMVTHEDGNTPPPVSTRPVLAIGEA